LDINQINIDKYFILKQSNSDKLKELKNRFKKMKNRSGVFNTIYENNKQRISIIKESLLYTYLDKFIIKLSMINHDVFKNLYLKVLFFDIDKVPNEEDICDVFSFWYILKYLKSIKSDFDKNSFISSELFENKRGDPIIDMIIKNIRNYYKVLNTNRNINESDVFTKDFYKTYDYNLMLAKIKLFKKAELILKNMKINYCKDQLNFIKMISSVNQNNGSYIFQITSK
jgi:hypothetical protein